MEINKTLQNISQINNTGKYNITNEDFYILHKYIYNIKIDKGFELITIVNDNKIRADYIIIYDIFKFKNSLMDYVINRCLL